MILVTGGAGFIGANFVLGWLALHDYPHWARGHFAFVCFPAPGFDGHSSTI